jgi:hypothetical protein
MPRRLLLRLRIGAGHGLSRHSPVLASTRLLRLLLAIHGVVRLIHSAAGSSDRGDGTA